MEVVLEVADVGKVAGAGEVARSRHFRDTSEDDMTNMADRHELQKKRDLLVQLTAVVPQSEIQVQSSKLIIRMYFIRARGTNLKHTTFSAYLNFLVRSS